MTHVIIHIAVNPNLISTRDWHSLLKNRGTRTQSPVDANHLNLFVWLAVWLNVLGAWLSLSYLWPGLKSDLIHSLRTELDSNIPQRLGFGLTNKLKTACQIRQKYDLQLNDCKRLLTTWNWLWLHHAKYENKMLFLKSDFNRQC